MKKSFLSSLKRRTKMEERMPEVQIYLFDIPSCREWEK